MSTQPIGSIGLDGLVPTGAPVRRQMRMFVAPVNRSAGAAGAVGFDARTVAAGMPLQMPAGWVDLGPCTGFVRRPVGAIEAVRTGAPSAASGQVRSTVGAEIEVTLLQWGKLQMALAAGVQQRNSLLLNAAGTTSMAVPLTQDAGGSTATVLQVGATAGAGFSVGDVVAVDADYAGQTGFVGAGAAGTWVPASVAAKLPVDYVRRVTMNVGVVQRVYGGALTLATGLLAGAPAAGMQVSKVLGFVDREGGGFFQEWSAVFYIEGQQGERVFFYYPRLQAMAGPAESELAMSDGLSQVGLRAAFRGLAVTDAEDGAAVVCYRTYVPAAGRLV